MAPLNPDQIWCAIPVYNNKDSIRDVVAGCRSILKNVVVVDDGSTDTDIAALLSDMDITALRHERNFGKGRAILTASKFVEDRGGLYMITIDADGQHYPRDIEKFIPLLEEDRASLIIGCRNFNTENVPDKSRFGRHFANFWLRLETGLHIDDCQSGFRAYPVKYLNQLKIRGSHYDFEAEVLAKAAWSGLQIKTVGIDVRYPEPGQRISAFRPFLDNLRISHTHAMLVGRRLLPWGHKRFIAQEKPDFKMVFHPVKLFKTVFLENATPAGLAAAAATGALFAILPLLFVHTFVILYVAARLNLNKIVAVNVQHFFMPPFVPALCIEAGYYLRHGKWLTNLSFEIIFAQFADRLFEWLLGSLIIAPLGALLTGCAVYFISTIIKKRIAVDG